MGKNVPKLRFKGFEGEWEEKRLGELCSVITKGTTPKGFSESGINFVKIESINGNCIDINKCLYIDETTHLNELQRSILKDKDILFAIAGATIGKCAIIDKAILPANTNQALSIIRLKKQISHRFILGILTSNIMKKYISLNLSVGAQPNLNLQQISDFKFRLPSLQEQEKIANLLSKVDRYIELQEKKVSELEKYKKGMMQKIFSQKIRFRKDDGGEYPEWEEKHLRDIADIIMGQSPSSSSYNEDLKGIPLIQGNADIKDRVTAPRIYTTETTRTCDVGDIIMSVRAPVGSIAQSIHYCCIGRGVCAIKTKENKQYLYQFLLSREEKWKNISQGSTFDSINKDDINSLKLKMPSMQEQRKIADFLFKIDFLIKKQSKRLEELKMWKKGLLQKMFV